MAVIVIILAVWGYFALNTGNPLWFRATPERSYAPDRIVIHYYGTTTELQSSNDDFRDFNAALNPLVYF